MDSENKLLGWREWVLFPELGLPRIKAKVDTGARTSCLHAFEVEKFRHNDSDWLRFKVHTYKKNDEEVITCEASVHDVLVVTDSGGHAEERFVIKSRIEIGSWTDDIEITLTARDSMKFRVLLGRTAMQQGNFLVNPSLSYLQGKKKKAHR